MSINVELTKQLLVASDQAYFTSAGQVQGSRLAPLPDKDSKAPEEYGDPFVYRDEPLFWYDEGFVAVAPVDKSDEIGAKALVYFNETTKEAIVAFGGTDGVSAQDWTSNTQNLGWDQWDNLRDPNQRQNQRGQSHLIF